jgi:hypothetical protein
MNTILLILFLIVLLIITIRTSVTIEGLVSIDEISEKVRKLKKSNKEALIKVKSELETIYKKYDEILQKIQGGNKAMDAEDSMAKLSSFQPLPPSKIVNDDSQFNDRCPNKRSDLNWSYIKVSSKSYTNEFSMNDIISKIQSTGKKIHTELRNKNF